MSIRSATSILSCAILAIGFFATTALAQTGDAADPALQRLETSPRHHEWVDIAAPGGRAVRTFVVFPEIDAPALAVVVIHENRGLNDWARSVADRLAEEGYVALAPDFLSGTGPGGGGTEAFASSDEARNGIYELPGEQVMSDLQAVVNHARQMEATTRRVVVGGFCWGGGKAFEASADVDGIVGVCVFYGRAPEDESAFERIDVPVHGFYGGDDFRITGAVGEVAERMESLSKSFEPVIYDGAGHAFMRRGMSPDGGEANIAAHDQAWARWLGLLAQWSHE